ncbi:G-type lectin S-receptor-like serine/threonine-protein kinase [Quillaja saponaria]|uniref:G-type lectin S-receptor-like serine/threonine-protein kinase n=1 Tax=Quillaja saponaria TaxID=32244 RepID=A0AAD7QET4_QUISA|nr:G-type lectin S-receptor-like serine/threonine-protein kinase [Quillaja saponaria]
MTTGAPTPIEDYYHRATINDHGKFQQLIYHKRNGKQWSVVWKAITQPCTVNSICGVFGFCTTPDDETVNCKCLAGYAPFDPSAPSKGCYPLEVKDFCAANSSASDFTVEQIDNDDMPNSIFADLNRVESADAESCGKEVMNNCFCMAAVLLDSIFNKK